MNDEIINAAEAIAIEIAHSGTQPSHLTMEIIVRILEEGQGIGVLKIINDGDPPDYL